MLFELLVDEFKRHIRKVPLKRSASVKWSALRRAFRYQLRS